MTVPQPFQYPGRQRVLAPLILLAAVSFGRWRRKRKGERSPLAEKLL